MSRGAEEVLSVYSDARAEYTKQLCIFLVPAYFQFFIDLLDRSKREMAHEPKRVLWQYQTHLNDIHEWNMERVSQEIGRIQTNCGCDYLEDLLTAVFIAHTKVLTAIRLGGNQKKVEIHIPKVQHFLFKVLCETAKLLWGATYLFREGISSIEKQQNYRAIEGMLNEGILQAIRTLVPVKSILKDFVAGGQEKEEKEDKEDNSDDEEEAPAPVPPEPIEQEALPTPAEAAAEPVVSAPQSQSALSAPQSSQSQESLSAPQLPPALSAPPSLPALSAPQHPQPPQPQPPQPPQPQQPQHPLIVLDDKPNVRFGQFDAVFDMSEPTDSDLIYDPKEDSDTEDTLQVLDEVGAPLGDDDFDTISEDTPTGLVTDDYEEL